MLHQERLADLPCTFDEQDVLVRLCILDERQDFPVCHSWNVVHFAYFSATTVIE
jgi:hypothetical protein